MTYRIQTHDIQPIADRVAQHLEIISENFQFSTRRTRILMEFVTYYLVLIITPMGRILIRWKSFRDNLEILRHPICNRLYMEYICIWMCTWKFIHIYMQICMCIYVCIYTHLYIYIHVYICLQMYIYLYIIHIHKYIHMYICIYI